MSTALKNRLDRIEAVVMPKPEQKVCVLMAPQPGASPDVVAAYEKKLAEANASGHKVLVIRLVPLTKKCESGTFGSEVIDGIEYFTNSTEAALRAASLTPSAMRNKDALADILQGLSGKVIGPVKGPLVL